MNKTALDQYEKVVTDALKKCSAKLRKSFITAFIQITILYMILPKKDKFHPDGALLRQFGTTLPTAF